MRTVVVYAQRSTLFAPQQQREEALMKLMKTVVLELPALAFVVGTRAALAAGVGLLLSSRFSAQRRRVIGTALFALGAATTIPAALSVLRGIRTSDAGESPVSRDRHLIGATRFPRRGDDVAH